MPWCPADAHHRKLDALARTRTEDEGLAIIDKDDRVHMAHMDIHFTHSTNGVAALHTEILKNSELHGFLRAVPGKVQQQDQRHHLPPLAAGMRPGPDR